ncbi:MAG: hypothetical protein HYZ91_02800 [Candidatus Omnitrophica bacterium]|nr:hypothetical protein [Candidatus Omnitrophota bacterium]
MANAPNPIALSRVRIPHVEEYYDQLAYELDPVGVYRLCQNQRLPHVTINEEGYRGKRFSGNETIILLGDSVTFGIGASNDEAVLARFLEAASGEPVADASVRAYRVFQQYAQLPRLLERLPRTRRVLLWCGFADLSYWVMTGGCVEGAFQLEWKYRANAAGARAAASGWRRRLRTPQLCERIQRVLVGRPTKVAARETASLEALVAHVATYVIGIRDVCAARGIAITTVLQPFIRQRPTDAELRRIIDLCDQKTLEKCGQGWYVLAPQFVERFQRALTERGLLDLIDCQAFVSEADFFDQAHLREAALQRIAARLVERHPGRVSHAGTAVMAGAVSR